MTLARYQQSEGPGPTRAESNSPIGFHGTLDKLPVSSPSNSSIMRTRNSFMFTDFPRERAGTISLPSDLCHTQSFKNETRVSGAISILSSHFNPHGQV